MDPIENLPKFPQVSMHYPQASHVCALVQKYLNEFLISHA